MPGMVDAADFRMTELTACGGCASKAGPAALARVLAPLAGLFNAEHHPDLLVGLGVADDAAVYRINSRTAIVATIDFFAPLVDDPFTYGAIAAANAMSDVYAMGGEVVLALNVAAFPEDMPDAVVTEVLRGGATKVAEAGGVVAGGHTITDDEPKYGLSVLGLVHPKRLLSKAGLRPGDVLYLTKPIGTGTILSAAKQGKDAPRRVDGAVASMLTLNRHASHLALAAGVRAATDVTGFGLMGHLWEMAERSGVTVTLEAAAVPLLAGAREASTAGVHTSGEGRNRDWVGAHATVASTVDPDVGHLLFDPQTSGGLLIGCPARRAPAFEASFAADRAPLWRVGTVAAGTPSIDVR
jgi:selenide, water dikinase